MDSSRQRQQTAEIIHTRCLEMLSDLMVVSVLNWPLPPPAIVDSELPTVEPESATQIIEQVEGLFMVDRAKFNSLLEECRESMIPHRLSLTSDPDKEGEKWLLRRLIEVARRILFGVCEGWLAMALDKDAPDVTRWYTGIALANGLFTQGDGLAENRGYHILESIAMTHPPGRWPTRPLSGSHQLDWNKQDSGELNIDENSGGIDAAHWLLDALDQGSDERKVLLVKWMRLMLERPILVEKMALPNRFEQMVRSQPELVAAELVSCVPRLLEVNPESGLLVLTALQTRLEPHVSFALADILPSLLRTSLEVGLAALDQLANSEDPGARSAGTAALKELATIDSEAFLSRIKKSATDEDPGIRRLFIQTCLRDYLELDRIDSLDILVPLWLEDDEVAGIRMRELLLRMQDVDIESFAIIGKMIHTKSATSLEKFWSVLEVRNHERALAWKTHIIDQGPIPEPLL